MGGPNAKHFKDMNCLVDQCNTKFPLKKSDLSSRDKKSSISAKKLENCLKYLSYLKISLRRFFSSVSTIVWTVLLLQFLLAPKVLNLLPLNRFLVAITFSFLPFPTILFMSLIFNAIIDIPLLNDIGRSSHIVFSKLP